MSYSKKQEFETSRFIYCRSTNMQYVVKTNRQLRFRINEHRSTISRVDSKTPVARHFTEENHTVNELSFCGRVYGTSNASLHE